MTTPRVAFISGPLDASPTYFSTHYIPPLTHALDSNSKFLIGPAPGIDTLSLHHLLTSHCPPSNITIYMAAFEYADLSRRNHYLALGLNVKEVSTAGQGTTTRMRDEEMTRDSDYDVLRFRTEEEAKREYGVGWWPRVSNTEVNYRRRKGDLGLEYRGEGAVVEGEERGKGLGERLRGYFR